MAPRADPHADGAIGARFGPVPEAGFGIQFPSQAAVNFPLFTVRNRSRRAGTDALFAEPTEILYADIRRLIAGQG